MGGDGRTTYPFPEMPLAVSLPTNPAPLDLAELGIVGDRRSAALLTRAGRVVWYCPGRFHRPSLLAALLDEARGGDWRLEWPGAAPAGRAYLGDSAVLDTRLDGPGGALTLTDFMPLGEGAPRGLCRRLTAAPSDLALVLNAAPNYALQPADPRPEGRGVRVGGRWLYGSHPLEVRGQSVRMRVPADEPAWAFLADAPRADLTADDPARWQAATLAHWAGLAQDDDRQEPYGEAVRDSLRALRACSDEETGGTVAAPTTSLPEVPGGQANWDYRYVWLRDAGMVVSALTRAGNLRAGRRFLDFVCRYGRPQGELPLAPFLTTEGELPPPETPLPLAGYADSRPVRLGNDARDQLQLDAYGNLLLAAKLIYERSGERPHWAVVERLADFLSERWADDDSGVWEERTPRPYVAGKVLSACALTYLAPYADPTRAGRWRAAADAARAWVERYGRTSTGAYAYIAGGEAVDVTAALYPVWGYCPPDSPAMLATVAALEERARGHLYRRHLEGEEGRGEGFFMTGTFWMAQYWVMRDPARARTILDAALAHANDLGLLAEEVSADGALLGNLPQTFVHGALIGAVVDLREAEQKARAERAG